jgi:hypothetical protein
MGLARYIQSAEDEIRQTPLSNNSSPGLFGRLGNWFKENV